MALRRLMVVVLALALASCSSDGAVPTTVTSGETAATAPATTLPSSTTSTMQPTIDIRSGEILAGNFASVVDRFSDWPDGEVKIYRVPFDHRVALTGPLEVSVEPLDSTDPAVVQTFEVRASSAGVVFWPSGTKFPAPGRYRLTATAPAHWGCFELTV
ncbi:MAG TPA: hypothetical protein VF148_08985 [Acidimicrobiia bacterium]